MSENELAEIHIPESDLDASVELRNRVLKAIRGLRNNPRGVSGAVEELTQILYIIDKRIDKLRNK